MSTGRKQSRWLQLKYRVQIWTGLKFGTTGLQLSSPDNSTSYYSLQVIDFVDGTCS